MAGKWLIFWCSLSLNKSWASICESIHIISHFWDFFDLYISHPSSIATSSTTSYCVPEITVKNTWNIEYNDIGIDRINFIFNKARDWCWFLMLIDLIITIIIILWIFLGLLLLLAIIYPCVGWSTHLLIYKINNTIGF